MSAYRPSGKFVAVMLVTALCIFTSPNVLALDGQCVKFCDADSGGSSGGYSGGGGGNFWDNLNAAHQQKMREYHDKSVHYNELGISASRNGNYEQAIEYYKQAVRWARMAGSVREISLNRNNIANVYLKWGNRFTYSDPRKALKLYKRGLKDAKEADTKADLKAQIKQMKSRLAEEKRRDKQLKENAWREREREKKLAKERREKEREAEKIRQAETKRLAEEKKRQEKQAREAAERERKLAEAQAKLSRSNLGDTRKRVNQALGSAANASFDGSSASAVNGGAGTNTSTASSANGHMDASVVDLRDKQAGQTASGVVDIQEVKGAAPSKGQTSKGLTIKEVPLPKAIVDEIRANDPFGGSAYGDGSTKTIDLVLDALAMGDQDLGRSYQYLAKRVKWEGNNEHGLIALSYIAGLYMSGSNYEESLPPETDNLLYESIARGVANDPNRKVHGGKTLGEVTRGEEIPYSRDLMHNPAKLMELPITSTPEEQALKKKRLSYYRSLDHFVAEAMKASEGDYDKGMEYLYNKYELDKSTYKGSAIDNSKGSVEGWLNEARFIWSAYYYIKGLNAYPSTFGNQ